MLNKIKSALYRIFFKVWNTHGFNSPPIRLQSWSQGQHLKHRPLKKKHKIVGAIKWLGAKFRDHVLGLVFGAITGFIIGFVWSAPTDIQFVPSSWGEHCPEQVFAAAEDAGAVLHFQPATVRQMAICGPGRYPGGDAVEGLKSYLLKYQLSCFQLKETKSGAFTITPNLKDKASLYVRAKNLPVFTCRCHPEQVAAMFRNRKSICGQKTP